MKTLIEMKTEFGELQTRREELKAKADKSEAENKEYIEVLAKQKKLMGDIATAEAEASIDATFLVAAPVPSSVTGGAPVADSVAYPLGDFLMDVHKHAMRKDPGARFENQNKKFKAAASGMNESAPSDGGFLVGTEQAGMLATRAYNEGQVAALCQRIQISGPFNGLKYASIDESSRADGSRSGGVLSYWKNEGNAATAKAPKFREDTMNLEKLIGLAYVTEELLQDSTALAGIVMAEFGKEFAFQLDDKVLNGTGAGQPMGILNAPALVSQAKETGQTAATITFENIIKMYARLWSGSNMATTRWVCNRECFPQLMSLAIKVGTAGYPLYIPGNSLTGAPNGTLLGIPVVFAEQALALGTAGDIYLADFSQYRIIEKAGIQSASSMHVLFSTDEMAYRFTMRVNGQPLWNKPLTPYKGTSSTVSPFVNLAVRS
jgi:HK97 family phage major capsid protein